MVMVYTIISFTEILLKEFIFPTFPQTVKWIRLHHPPVQYFLHRSIYCIKCIHKIETFVQAPYTHTVAVYRHSHNNRNCRHITPKPNINSTQTVFAYHKEVMKVIIMHTEQHSVQQLQYYVDGYEPNFIAEKKEETLGGIVENASQIACIYCTRKCLKLENMIKVKQLCQENKIIIRLECAMCKHCIDSFWFVSICFELFSVLVFM